MCNTGFNTELHKTRTFFDCYFFNENSIPWVKKSDCHTQSSSTWQKIKTLHTTVIEFWLVRCNEQVLWAEGPTVRATEGHCAAENKSTQKEWANWKTYTSRVESSRRMGTTPGGPKEWFIDRTFRSTSLMHLPLGPTLSRCHLRGNQCSMSQALFLQE